MSSELYSRIASASYKKEAAANAAVTPNVFFGFNSIEVADDYPYTSTMPVKNNRAKNIRAANAAIPPIELTINLNVEPKTFPDFVRGMFGLTSGQYMPITSASGAFTVGETVTGGTSAKTATVVADLDGDVLLVSSASGEFTDGETITGGSSSSTATLTEFDTTVFGHAAVAPATNNNTYSLQLNYLNHAVRYLGVRYYALGSLNQTDNVITAGVKCLAQSQFRHAKVTAITSSGAGSKTITVDQTQGLVAGDTVKLFNYSDNTFKDFSASSVATHTIDAVSSTTTFTVTNLQTSTAVGDLIVLAPQTATYSVGNEFIWIGGSIATLGADIDNLATQCIEDFELETNYEVVPFYCANAVLFENRFPAHLVPKGFEASGKVTTRFRDERFYRLARLNTAQAVRIQSIGDLIGSTGIENELRVTLSSVQFDQYAPQITEDDVVPEEIPFTSFYDGTLGWSVRILIVNSTSSY